jgi:hypothetical protein
MFHIANRIYLDYDYNFNHENEYIVASNRWSTHPITVSKSVLVSQVSSFDELLKKDYEDDVENFWAAMLARTNKVVIFLDAETLTKLQFQYWKSIFKNGVTAAALHKLHASWVESNRLSAQYQMVGNWDPTINAWSRPNVLSELPVPTLAESTAIFNSTVASDTIKSMDKKGVSIEYLLADFFYNKNTEYKNTLMQKIKLITWDNWLDELEHLKYEILSGSLDANKLDTSLNITIGNIESELAKSDLLKWTVDPMFNQDVEYIRETYDPQIFIDCYTKLAEIWQHQYDDMAELSELINGDQYETLLERDIARNYGSSYTRTRFYSKANHVFVTWCYELVRQNRTSDLAQFALRK